MRLTDRCDFFSGAHVVCGDCGTQRDFIRRGAGGGDAMAREAGWQIEWRPRPFVRCPNCRTPGQQSLT